MRREATYAAIRQGKAKERIAEELARRVKPDPHRPLLHSEKGDHDPSSGTDLHSSQITRRLV